MDYVDDRKSALYQIQRYVYKHLDEVHDKCLDELIADKKRLEFIVRLDKFKDEFGDIELSVIREMIDRWIDLGGMEFVIEFGTSIDMNKDNVESAGDAGSVTTETTRTDRGLNPGQTSAPAAVDISASMWKCSICGCFNLPKYHTCLYSHEGFETK